MTRLLWISDAGSHTGFGRVTQEIAGGLSRRGHDVSVLALNYAGDHHQPSIDAGLKLYRANLYGENDSFGARRVRELIETIKPEVVVIVHDPAAVWQYLFENPYDPTQSILGQPVIAYCPVDGYDYPPDWVELLPQAVSFVAMSEHGQRTFSPSGLVYHGVNPDEFWPVHERPIEYAGALLETKEQCKRAVGIDPDQFVILRVDTNSGRKDYAATFKAVCPLLERHREFTLYIHANTDPRLPGVNIPVMLNRYDLAPGQVVETPFRNSTLGWPQERMNILYNAADVFVSTSRGEGYGLSLAEAAACGVPVVAQNVSAIPEVVGPGGVLIEPQRRITVPAGQDLWLADIDAFTETIERLYTDPVWRDDLGLAGRKHVTESFNGWDTAVDRFHDFIESAAARWRQSQEATTDGPD